jgi:glycosyltransferase involved in cell wall biosynthesis
VVIASADDARRPRVTVVIATYNWSSVLPYAIGSVLRQTLTDLELLVVGDGCTDDSAETVAHFVDPRVRWINLAANTGHQSGPNNEGLRQGRGELVAYLGHDDLWLPHHLALLVAALDAGADVACGVTEIVRPGGRPPRSVPAGRFPLRPGAWVPPTGLVHRRQMALDVGGWRHPLELTVDPEIDLLTRLLATGARPAFVPRLTAVKLPAAQRRDAYRLRRCEEQAAWFARIGSEPDFEQRELVAMLLGVERAVLVLLPLRLRRLARDLRDRLLPQRLRARSRRRRARARFARRRRLRGLSSMPRAVGRS